MYRNVVNFIPTIWKLSWKLHPDVLQGVNGKINKAISKIQTTEKYEGTNYCYMPEFR